MTGAVVAREAARRCCGRSDTRRIRTRSSASIVGESKTAMGETVEIDHLRDLYWAEAVLREREELAERTVRKAS
jgi:hypothetical protein